MHSLENVDFSSLQFAAVSYNKLTLSGQSIFLVLWSLSVWRIRKGARLSYVSVVSYTRRCIPYGQCGPGVGGLLKFSEKAETPWDATPCLL